MDYEIEVRLKNTGGGGMGLNYFYIFENDNILLCLHRIGWHSDELLVGPRGGDSHSESRQSETCDYQRNQGDGCAYVASCLYD